MIGRFFRFIGRIVKAALKTVKDFVVGIVKNVEAVTILGLATVGTAALLAELPFIIAMPMWIESSLVIPVLATTIVLTIVFIMERRLSLCPSCTE